MGQPQGFNCLPTGGDPDCSGESAAVGALDLLRILASLTPLPHPQDCPEIGDEIPLPTPTPTPTPSPTPTKEPTPSPTGHVLPSA